MSYLLIIGAKSDIAKAVAREYAANGYDLYLAARGVDALADFARDLNIRYQSKVTPLELDILDYDSHHSFYETLDPKPETVLLAVGYLGVQEEAQSSFSETEMIIDTNFSGPVSILNIIANDFQTRKNGILIGISSVAGDRGRQSNYLYGSAKAAFSTYLSGLRNRLHADNVHVMTVKPGFVATSMTKDMDLPEKLTAQPQEVAKAIFNAQEKKKNIVYIKWFWFWIMMIIKAIPEFQFKKMNI